MAFHLFERAVVSGRSVIRPIGNKISLAGYNLFHKAWPAYGRTVDSG
jgi:hypothetical protein